MAGAVENLHRMGQKMRHRIERLGSTFGASRQVDDERLVPHGRRPPGTRRGENLSRPEVTISSLANRRSLFIRGAVKPRSSGRGYKAALTD